MSLAFFNLGNIYQNKKKFNKAKQSYETALRLNPNYYLAFCNLGSILLDTGNPNEAIECYKKALSIKPDMVEALNNMGNSYRKIGKTEKAELYYRKALNIKENYSPAYSNLLFLQSSISHDTDLHKSEAKNFAKIFRKDIKDPYTNWPYEYNTNTLRVGFVSGILQSPCWIF